MTDRSVSVAAADADTLRSWADAERAKGAELAAFLEDVATNGIPDPDEATPWEEVREAHLEELAAGQNGSRAA